MAHHMSYISRCKPNMYTTRPFFTTKCQRGTNRRRLCHAHVVPKTKRIPLDHKPLSFLLVWDRGLDHENYGEESLGPIR